MSNQGGGATPPPIQLDATAYSPQPSSYRELAGVKFFWGLLALAAIITVGLILYVILDTPSIPQPTSNSTLDSLYLASVIRERALVVDNAVKVGQLLLISLCLPLLTAILGYLFGQRAESEPKH